MPLLAFGGCCSILVGIRFFAVVEKGGEGQVVVLYLKRIRYWRPLLLICLSCCGWIYLWTVTFYAQSDGPSSCYTAILMVKPIEHLHNLLLWESGRVNSGYLLTLWAVLMLYPFLGILLLVPHDGCDIRALILASCGNCWWLYKVKNVCADIVLGTVVLSHDNFPWTVVLYA